jgi:5'-nucleotidase
MKKESKRQKLFWVGAFMAVSILKIMVENVVVSNTEKLEKLKTGISRGGAKGLHILSDFERTLTYAFVGGEKVPSILSVLRSSGDYLGDDYAKEAQALFDKYHPIEINPKIPIEAKKRAMEEWWMTHFDLLIKKRLNKKHLERVVESGKIRLREGAEEFFDILKKYEIPFVIISSSGLGEVISMILEKEGKLYSNVYIISNSFLWDKNGNAIGVKKPIIHSVNKDETVLKNFPFYKKIKNRKNVLLLGDNLEDVGMIKGFDCDNLIKIGFLNEKIEENLTPYRNTYDVIILNDSSMNYVNSLLREVDKINMRRQKKYSSNLKFNGR